MLATGDPAEKEERKGQVDLTQSKEKAEMKVEDSNQMPWDQSARLLGMGKGNKESTNIRARGMGKCNWVETEQQSKEKAERKVRSARVSTNLRARGVKGNRGSTNIRARGMGKGNRVQTEQRKSRKESRKQQ